MYVNDDGQVSVMPVSDAGNSFGYVRAFQHPNSPSTVAPAPSCSIDTRYSGTKHDFSESVCKNLGTHMRTTSNQKYYVLK